MEDLLIFGLGICLLAIEVFVTPGFGVMGFSGIVLIFFSFISAMVEHMPGQWRPIELSPEALAIPFLKVTLSFAGAVILVGIAGRFVPQTRMFRSLTLGSVAPENPGDSSLIGLEGTALCDLRPSGAARFGGRKRDVVTRGDYIPGNSAVRIVEVHGNRLVVEEIKPG
jgi:membrane-bound serine protease (ClpP class)